jgi:hypothetical protein
MSSHGESRPARCESCFEGFLRARDAEFLSSYAELGVTSRRLIAETCLRALVMETPEHRKVLAMNIMEQYVGAAGELVGLYYALKDRARRPVMQAVLDFKLDRSAAVAFFHEITQTPSQELLAGLGLPTPEALAERCPSLPEKDVEDLRSAMEQMLYDLAYTGRIGETATLAIAQMAGERHVGAALVKQSAWLDSRGLRNDQVAAMAIDGERRTVSVTAIAVDEKKLENVLTNINAMTRAAQNMIYGVLTMYQEDERARRRDSA